MEALHTNNHTTENNQLATYMKIGGYESSINKYAVPSNPGKWMKYTRLKKKVMEWQNNIQ